MSRQRCDVTPGTSCCLHPDEPRLAPYKLYFPVKKFIYFDMPSFKEAREMLLLSYDQGLITDEELILLLEENTAKNPEFSYISYDRFDLENIEEPECKSLFRVEKNDIPLLADALRLPEYFRCSQRTRSGKIEGLCIFLKKMAYPCRYADMIPLFGRPVPELSMITNKVIDYLYEEHGHRISDWNHQILSPADLQKYADAVSQRGAALDNCFGFVDGTVRPICRPIKHQRVMYNGHKRVHSLKFQSVTLPNGLIANMFGPIEGKRHDAGMLADSHLIDHLEQLAFSPTGHPMCLYGDPAYPLRVHLQAPFRDIILTPDMERFNKSMSSVRTSVEWIFGDIVKSFKHLDFKNNLKIGLSTVGKMYLVCSLIRNALTCMYSNQTSEFFNVDPPTIHDYFA